MVKSQSLVNTSIVAVYPNLDLRAIKIPALRRIADMETDPYGSSFFSDPQKGMKLVLPQRKVEIDITSSKVRIADVFVQNPKSSDLISRYLRNVTEILKPYTAQIYGFNYIFNVVSKGKLKLLRDSVYHLIEGAEFRYQSVVVKFHATKEVNDSYLVKIDEVDNNRYQITLNYETAGDINNTNEVNKKFTAGYEVAKEVVNDF